MRLFALSDLHYSGIPPQKPMDVFGPHWANHRERIEQAWRETIGEEDYVLVGGDISWAMRLEESLPDLEAIADLPGKKILLQGNHDFWWSGVQKMRRLTGDRLFFLYNNFIPVGNIAVCGTRGWLAPGDANTTAEDEAVFTREVRRLERSLKLAREAGYTEFYAVSHYPPFNERREPTALLTKAKEFGVRRYIYGHLHDEQSFAQVPQELEGVRLYLTSADYLGFRPQEIPLA
ncbi:MAG: metallophosphoesterase [Veillonellaceae bacterium]|nr:metallophosphoesterase [Veillonellaceae bacterium]